MERLIVITIAVLGGAFFLYWFSRMVSRKPMREFIFSHQWLMHPNAICCWRASIALVAFGLYFLTSFQSAAILIYGFASILDGVDGVVARSCNLGTKLGEWLDPLCDKLTYLPPMVGFAYRGIVSVELVWTLVVIELVGQFLARRILSWLGITGAANNFGKIKAIICFGLVIFCTLLDKTHGIVDIGDEVLIACIILAAASIVFKFISSRLYADILSTLNFCCGVASLVLTHNGRFAWAICIIIMGQLFDLFDGRMAEKHGGTKYGPYLDDVADFVSFGLAPAYVIIKSSGGGIAWFFAALYVGGVAYRLYRFVAVDKKRNDLPPGIFNGLPSPAGALLVLGATLVVPAHVLLGVATLSVALMISHIRFAHFGRVIIKQIPRPLFFVINATIIVALAFILKTKDVRMFGYLILGSMTLYIIAGRKFIQPASAADPENKEHKG